MSATETKTESPPPPTNSKEAKNNKSKRNKKKKKHISKHVIKAKSEARQKVTAAVTAAEDSSKKNKVAAESVKDPSEASEYLQAWQGKEGWKFNKNTQSWLLRHMYEAEKVSKTTFTILLEYMKGFQGKDAKKRVLEEATARAKRYRDYEKSKEASAAEEVTEESNATVKETGTVAIATTTATTSSAAEDDGSYGLAHWNTLDDHDKRKEYKRARRVLEVLTADQ